MKIYQKPETVNINTIGLDLIAIECVSFPPEGGDVEKEKGVKAPKVV